MCCGSKSLQRRVARIQQPVNLQTGPVFEYLGRTGLTTIGAVTGMRYRFERPSARLHVHPQDSNAMSGIPGLRRIP
jgi:hypothetical protein